MRYEMFLCREIVHDWTDPDLPVSYRLMADGVLFLRGGEGGEWEEAEPSPRVMAELARKIKDLDYELWESRMGDDL